MKINERALEIIKATNTSGEKLAKLFETLSKEFTPEVIAETSEIEFTMGFDKDDAAPIGDLLPEITLRLKVKE